MSRLAICDRCGAEMGDSFEMPLTRFSRHLRSSVHFFYEGDLCDDCIDEIISFIKDKPISDKEVRHASDTAASTLEDR